MPPRYAIDFRCAITPPRYFFSASDEPFAAADFAGCFRILPFSAFRFSPDFR